MDSLEVLKEELLAQKTAIEAKGGTVTVGNSNPSPHEITLGIATIEAAQDQTLEITEGTATASDVLIGKTFYAGSSELQTGTLELATPTATAREEIETYYFYSKNATTTETIEYEMPNYITYIRPYAFAYYPDNLNITLSENLTEIDQYAFSNASNLTFANFTSLTNLTTLGTRAFDGVNGIDLANLPNCLSELGDYCFWRSYRFSQSISFPSNLTSIGVGAVANFDDMYDMQSVDISSFKLKKTGESLLRGYHFDCDLVIPSWITHLYGYFNYNGCFKNVTIPTTCRELQTMSFYPLTTIPASRINTETITFLNPSPPTIGSNAIGSAFLNTNCKIYVPDNSVDAYKAVTRLKNFASIILPMSEKP